MPYRQKGSPYWYAYFYQYDSKTGRRVRTRKSTETSNRREAEALEAKWKADAYQQRHWNAPPAMPVERMLAEYLDSTASIKRSHHADKIRAATLIQSFAGIDAYRLGAAHIRQYITRRRGDGVMDSTINRELALLSAAINAYNKGHDANLPNPVKSRKLPEPLGRERWLTAQEADRLIEEAQRGKFPWIADFIRLALYTGMRLSEVIELEWSQVDLASAVIHLTGRQTKSAKPRSIPLGEGARQALATRAAFRMRHCPASPWVFCKANGAKVRSIKNGFAKACERAGIKDCSPHTLRHTCASWLVQRGVRIEVVQKILGHSSVLVTQRYSHLRSDDLREAMKTLNTTIESNDDPNNLEIPA